MAGIDEYTVLMLHMDGADESTTFMDSSASEHTVTASGGAQIDTAQKVFGSASGIFDGAGGYLAIPDSDDWTFGSDDFTIDFRINFSSLPSVGSPYQNIIGQYVDSGNEWRLFAERSSLTGLVHIKAWFKYEGAWLLSMVSEGIISEANSWYHIAFIRYGNNFDIYINGIQIGIPVVVSPTMPNYASDLIVGKRINDLYFNGWIDEFRISKGIARWTENFEPPTEPYSEEGEEAMGIHTVRANRARFGNDFTTNYMDINGGVITMAGTSTRKLTVRPNVNMGIIGKNSFKPTAVEIGAFQAFSMPIYNTDNEELYFRMRTPFRWDGTTNPYFKMMVALSAAEDVGDKFQFRLDWNNTSVTGLLETDVVTVDTETTVITDHSAQYSTYSVAFLLDYDNAGLQQNLAARNNLVGRVRRIAASGSEVSNEILVVDWITEWSLDKLYGSW